MRWTWKPLDRLLGVAQVIAELNRQIALLQPALVESGVDTAAAGDTTPSVAGLRYLRTGNTGATSITQFDGGRPGQLVVLHFNDANTTLVHGTNLQLLGGVNFTGAVGQAKLFASFDGVVFREVPR
jgi:hypothetical protein